MTKYNIMHGDEKIGETTDFEGKQEYTPEIKGGKLEIKTGRDIDPETIVLNGVTYVRESKE